MSTLFKNIGCIVGIDESGVLCKKGKDMAFLAECRDAWMLVSDGVISDYGNGPVPEGIIESIGLEIVDAENGWVFPSFCDSHSHVVYAGSREKEFLDKINGLSYEEIAERGGGILNSADLLHNTSEDELFVQSMSRVNEVMKMGTGALEIKSGYGLSTDDELKMLRVIRRIKENSPMIIRSTFLGAHAVGRAYTGRKDAYVDLICKEMIPEIGRNELADFVDVFCDRRFFTVSDTERILTAAAEFGLRPKIHANELDVSGGVQVGVKYGALSVDHLERTTDEEIRVLANSSTMPTLLPGASFFLGMPYANGRGMIDAGLGVALASDYNPGSSPSGNMKMVVSLGCIKMKLTPPEALNAATINGAYAMEVSDKAGSITRGKCANFFITSPLPSLSFFPYAYTTPMIRHVYVKGVEV